MTALRPCLRAAFLFQPESVSFVVEMLETVYLNSLYRERVLVEKPNRNKMLWTTNKKRLSPTTTVFEMTILMMIILSLRLDSKEVHP